MRQPSWPPPCGGKCPLPHHAAWEPVARSKTQLTQLTSGRTRTPAGVGLEPPLSLLLEAPSVQGKGAESGHPVGKKNRPAKSESLPAHRGAAGGRDPSRGGREAGAEEFGRERPVNLLPSSPQGGLQPVPACSRGQLSVLSGTFEIGAIH